MKPLMNKLIFPFQNGFVPGRQIGDSIMLPHELLHTMGKKRKSKQFYMALKLYIEKAYDRIEWNFLNLALVKANFDPFFINLIMTCVTTCSFKLKVKNMTSTVWKPYRGLRQGDPLSLFVYHMSRPAYKQIDGGDK